MGSLAPLRDALPASLSHGGVRLQDFLDSVRVETRWLAGRHIVWQTGQENGPTREGSDDHTHCSALAAAIALALDIYLLRPPHHGQQLLSNAQVRWLSGKPYPGPTAAEAGWRDLGRSGDAGPLARAVAAANAGKLVIGGYRQPPVIDPTTGARKSKPGHVVVVRPQLGPINAKAGPLVTMAGRRNWRAIHMGPAFHSHPNAWPDAIRLFVHDTDLEADVVPEKPPP